MATPELIKSSLILSDLSELKGDSLKIENVNLLNYLCALSTECLNIFIKSQNTAELIRLFNLCDYLNIPHLLKNIAIEIANRMNKSLTHYSGLEWIL